MSNDFLCPECGEFVYRLIERTGWCVSCTKEIDRNETTCSVCGRDKSPQDACLYCRLERWFEHNADHVEHYILQGHTLTKAIELVRLEVTPRCASCGALMRRSGRAAVFCRKNERCRKAVRRYSYLTQGLGMNRPQALSQVLEELDQ